MLAPEVWNFPSPKILSSLKDNVDFDALSKIINMNNFYESIVVTVPDELNIPKNIEESLIIDKEYYQINNCSVTTFLEPEFIENFVKRGSVTCLTIGKSCIVHNCAAITSEGILIIHVRDFIYQSLGLEGTKRPNNFYEIQVDLNRKIQEKVTKNLMKLEPFDFYITWEPHDDNICPSSIAKYFFDRTITVSVCQPQITTRTPSVKEIPSMEGSNKFDVEEWIGMLVHECDLTPQFDYISSYSQPESDNAIQSSRIVVMHSKAFYTPMQIKKICRQLEEYVKQKESDNYWVSLSMQTYQNSLWRWDFSRPKQFQYHDSSCTTFFSNNGNYVCSVGQIKF